MIARCSAVLAIVVSVVLFSSGCAGSSSGTRAVAPCLKPTQLSQQIEWGTYAETPAGGRTSTSHMLSTKGEITALAVGMDTTSTHVAWISDSAYCAAAQTVTDAFLKVQALHSPGQRGRFIRYSNPATGVYLQAVWNPDLSTFQSRDMRRLYDELMLLVPSD